MTFKTIEYMLAILEEGGFSRAAQRLYISQPALSQAIRKAEEEIGTPLFVRDTRSIHLTAAGELLVREGRELIKQRDDLVHQPTRNDPFRHIALLFQILSACGASVFFR